MDIEFCTNQELIDELMRRSTFVGFVVYSATEQKDECVHKDFRLKTSLTAEQTRTLTALAQTELSLGD